MKYILFLIFNNIDKEVLLYWFFLLCSSKVVVLTGAGISTECGIPDYRRFCLLSGAWIQHLLFFCNLQLLIAM